MAETINPGTGDTVLQDRYVTRKQIDSLISEHQPRWKQTPERAEKTRKLLNGEILAPIPENFKIAGADQFRVDAPQKYLVPYHQRNMLGNNPPRVKRWRMNDSEPGKIESTRIEQVMQAVMDDRYKFRDSVDILLMEGCCLSISLPATASMSQVPSLYEKDGATVKSRYQRNAKNQPKSKDDKTWRLSKKTSAKVHDAETRDILSHRIPLDNELLGPTAFIPVFGPGLVLDAVVVERYWTQTEIIKRKLVWDGMQAHMSPDGSASGSNEIANQGGSRIKVTELHAVDYQEDDDGDVGCHPYVAYMVDGGKGNRVPLQKRGSDGEMVDAIVCLRCEYGLTQPHFVMEWGLQWAHPDFDKKAMPFPLPFAQSWQAIDAILTGATVWAWWRGFPTLIEQPNANTPPDIDVMTGSPDDDDDDITEIAPLGIIRAKGTVTELGTQGPNQIVMQLVSFLSAANEEQSAANAAMGSDANSGFQASLSRAYAEEAMGDIQDSSINLFKRTSSVMFQLLCGIAERWGPVPIQRITPVPLGSRTSNGGRRREILDVTEDMAGGLYALDADFPPQPNLAKGQQWAEWSERGLVLLEEFREQIIGDENPEIFVARRMKQKIMESPEFMQKVMELVAQLEGNEAERQKLMALSSGQAETGTDGVVRPVVQPAMAPQGDPGALTGGSGMPNIAASSLGGAVAGPMGAVTQAAAAGGSIPQDIQMSPS